MKNTPVIILIILSLLLLLVVEKKSPRQSTALQLPTKENNVLAVKDTFSAKQDLYFYKHPYLNKAHQLNEERKYDSAIYYYKEAAAKFKTELQWESYVWVTSYIGKLYLFVAGKDHREALPYLQKALEKGHQNLSNNHPFVAITFFYFGLYYYYDQKADSALQKYRNALAVLNYNYKEPSIYTSDIYEEIGNVHYNLNFDNTEAEKHYLKSIEIKEALPNKTKDSVLTTSYYNLVKLYFSIRDFERAQTYCFKAIQFVPYAKKHRQYWSELLEGVLASLYSEQQIYPKAISKLKDVIQINNKSDGDKGFLCFYYNSLADIHSKSLNYDSATIYYKKALEVASHYSLFEDQALQAATTNYSLGMTFLKLKNYHLALAYLNKCLKIRLKTYGKKNIETAVAFQGIGTVYQEAGLPDSAFKFFQEAVAACTVNFTDSNLYDVPAVSNVNSSFHSFLILKDKASALKELYYKRPSDINLLQTSLAYYCIADTLISLFRLKYNQENSKLVFTRNNTIIYEEAIECAALLYERTKNVTYHNWIFNFIDKRKSSLLLEALNEEQIFRQAGIAAEDQNKYHLLQQRLIFLQSRLEEENQGNPDEAILKMLHEKMDVTEEEITEHQNKLSKKYAYYYSVQPITDTVSINDLFLFSRQHNSLVLEYFWGENAIYVLGIYKDKSEVLKINKGTELQKHFDTLQTNLTRGYIYATKEKDFISFQASSYYIYHSLVDSILSRFNVPLEENKPGIIVIPDGMISYIPFEALITTALEKEVNYQKLDYLIKHYAISYNYSARLLLKNYQLKNSSQGSQIFALSYSKDDASAGQFGPLNLLKRDTTTELPGSAKEIRAISFYMSGQFYMGDEATEDLFKKEAPSYDILHLAVHGQADNKNSYSSRLIFKKGKNSLNDGSLYSYEIYGLQLKAKLVVLSACESGLGKLNPGEGIYSIARGFAYAGCPSIVMSLWRINDRSTATIMADFYKYLSEENSIDQAIRKSKLHYINKADQRTAHPVNWAAFAPMGNMTPIIKKGSTTISISLLAVLIVLTVSIFFLVKRLIRKR